MSGQANMQSAVQPNSLRGEARLRIDGRDYLLRPSFGALVAAEQELGPLFALVERAASGQLALDEMAALLWHCIAQRPQSLSKDMVGQAVIAEGLANITPILRLVLQQILAGR
jgi:hypothetical protein